jgi:hypothetical protein
MRILRIGSLLFNYFEKLKTSGKFVFCIKCVAYTCLQRILEIIFNQIDI